MSAIGETGLFRPACEVILRLNEVLERKVDFGVRLKAAYDTDDKETLRDMIAECDVIAQGIEHLRLAHRAAWMADNKPFGWEVHDIRYGGLVMRFDTVKERLSAYLNGEISRLEELEEERLRLDGKLDEDAAPRFHSRFLWMRYQFYTTSEIL